MLLNFESVRISYNTKEYFKNRSNCNIPTLARFSVNLTLTKDHTLVKLLPFPGSRKGFSIFLIRNQFLARFLDLNH